MSSSSGVFKVQMRTLDVGSDAEKEETMLSIMNYAIESDANCVSLAGSGIIPLLLGFLNPSNYVSDHTKVCSIVTISNILYVRENHEIMVQLGVVGPLVLTLKSAGSDAAKGHAAVALGNLATNDTYSRLIGSDQVNGIPQLVSYLRSTQSDVGKEKAIGTLWNLCDNNVENKEKILDSGGIEPLVDFLTIGSRRNQEYSAGAISKLASVSKISAALSKAGAIPPLVAIITNGTELGKQHGALALRNLAANPHNKVAIPKANGIPPLIALLTIGTERCKMDATAAISSLAVTVKNKSHIGHAGGIPPIVQLLHFDDSSLLMQSRACSALKHLSGNARNIKEIGNCNAIPTLVKIFKNEGDVYDRKMREDAIECISNLSLDVMIDDGHILSHIWSMVFEVNRSRALLDEVVLKSLPQKVLAHIGDILLFYYYLLVP